MTKRIFFDEQGNERESPYPNDIRLKIREHHIREGQRGSTSYDPIALAARELFPNCLRVEIFSECLHLHADWRMTIWQPTDHREWQDWLFRYHTGQFVEPREFQLLRVYEEETDEERTDVLRRYGTRTSPRSSRMPLEPLSLSS